MNRKQINKKQIRLLRQVLKHDTIGFTNSKAFPDWYESGDNQINIKVLQQIIRDYLKRLRK